MSDNPTKTFKDFIGWAFIGLAGIVVALVSLIYSSLHADVASVELRTQQHVERIKGAEDRIDGIKESLQRIETDLRKANQRLEELNKRY